MSVQHLTLTYQLTGPNVVGLRCALILNSNQTFAEMGEALGKLVGRTLYVAEVKTGVSLTEDEQKARWRKLVAAGRTEESYTAWRERASEDGYEQQQQEDEPDPYTVSLTRQFREGLVQHLGTLYPELTCGEVEVQETGSEYKFSFELPSGHRSYQGYTSVLGIPSEALLAEALEAVEDDLDLKAQ